MGIKEDNEKEGQQERPIVERAHWNKIDNSRAFCSKCHYELNDHNSNIWPSKCPGCGAEMMGTIQPPLENVR